MTQVKDILSHHFPEDIASHLSESYREVERQYALGQWKTSELDAGHFVESARRAIEYQLFGSYKPFEESLGSFNGSVLSKYEQAAGHESYRMIMPRVLYSVYCVRNKRGVGHVGEVSPNHMDASLILASVKWCLAELIRLNSNLTSKEASLLVDQIVERQVEAIWDDGESFMVLNDRLTAEEKALITLYKKDNLIDSELQTLVEYSNSSRFKGILKKMKSKRLIDYLPDGRCKLSPIGAHYVEDKLLQVAN
ncbi:hypothetical protein [Marinobacter sp. F3R08]|uniref:hypothetical protein n=1 Tax=Marinobacter sp. F3R08 TaxID=2841559 RepID=UPI001C0A0D0B|nr:hypothetical protein [Marinobacter sp. F3R08]MBU2954028.1 hypothetical protein [Marinobacter sp. F3R08]